MAGSHSHLSPSSGDRWFACPGSVAAVRGIEEATSKYAAEGIEAHNLLESALRLGMDPMELVDPTNEAAVEMAEAVGYAIDYLHEYLLLDPDAEFHPEQVLEWGAMFNRPDLFGTCDIVIVAPTEHVMLDLKYGQGIVVEVLNNIQLKLYLLGVRAKYGPRSRYKMGIIQPRARHQDGPLRFHTITDVELLAFAEEARRAIAAAEAPDAPRRAGEHCRWCPAAGRCPTLAENSLKMAAVEFSLAAALDNETLEPRPTGNLTTVQIARLLKYADVVETWVKALNAEAKARALAGEHLPGYKLVAGRSNRNWADPAAAQLDLALAGLSADEIAPRSMVSPAGAEAVLKHHKLLKENKDIFVIHVVKQQGNPTLVSEADPRPEHVPFSEFEELSSHE